MGSHRADEARGCREHRVRFEHAGVATDERDESERAEHEDHEPDGHPDAILGCHVAQHMHAVHLGAPSACFVSRCTERNRVGNGFLISGYPTVGIREGFPRFRRRCPIVIFRPFRISMR